MAHIKPKFTENEARSLLRYLERSRAREDLSPDVRRAVGKLESAARETLNVSYVNTHLLYR